MERNHEEVLKGARPEVVVGTGQKVAGGVLRAFGLLMFLPGAIGFFLLLGFGILGSQGELDWEQIMALAGIVAVIGAVMAMGSLMGAFGVVVSGAVGSVSGAMFLRWALANVGRDLLVVVGVCLCFGAMLAGPVLESVLVALVMALAGVGCVVAAFWLNRVMRWLERGKD